MKKLITTTLALFLFASLFGQAWIQRATFPGLARELATSFSIGNYGFIGCGINGSGAYYTDFYKWNSTTNTWSAIASYPGAGQDGNIGFVIEGKAYVGLGYGTGGVSKDLWRYDTAANTWTAMTTFPGTARYVSTCFVLGHKAYIIGGSSGGPPYLNDVWVYDAHANSWHQLNNNPAGNISTQFAFSIANHGYIGGGWDGTNLHSACWEYDSTNDTWTSIAALPVALSSDNPFVIGSKAYLADGTVSGGFVRNGYVYDTVAKTWTIYTNLGSNGIERKWAPTFTINNKGYIGTGSDSLGNLLNNVWEFAPDTIIIPTPLCNNWTKQTNFPGSVRELPVSFSIGNYGFMGCGTSNTGLYYKDFYKWNSNSNAWSAITSYPGAGGSGGIAFVIEGKAYVGLGYGSSGTSKDLWRYDTISNGWTAMTTFPGTARYVSSCFVLGHKAYLISGSAGGPPYLNDIWVYDAHANSWHQLNNSPAGNLSGVVAFAIGNRGYIGGGWDGTNDHSGCWEYDSTNDTWTSIASFPVALASDNPFVIGSKAYLADGLVNGGFIRDAYVYDTVGKTWTVYTNLGTNGIERKWSTTFTINNKGYIGTGMDSIGNVLNNFWQYVPCSDTLLYLYSAQATLSPKCNGDVTGSANVNVTGGFTPYTYSWNSVPVQTTANATGLSAGTYTVTVTDSHGSTLTASVTITQPTQLRDSIVSSTTNSATVGVKGGTAPYTYLWMPGGQTTATAIGLGGGTYTITTKDANGCSITDSATISSLDSVHICIVSVDTSSLHNIIVWNNSGWFNIDSVKVYFLNSVSQWQLLAEVAASAGQYIDTSSINSPNRNTVRYVITGIDSRGNQEPISASTWHNTLFINVNKSTGTFNWSGTGYLIEGNSLPVITYVLYRDTVSNGHWKAIDSVSGTQNTMTDPDYSKYPHGRWYVEARLNISGCTTPNERVESGSYVSSRSNQEGDLILGIQQVTDNNESISIYPNPVNQTLNIKFSEMKSASVNIKVTDVTGRIIMQMDNTPYGNTSSVNVSTLSAGVYFIRIANAETQQTIKFIKE